MSAAVEGVVTCRASAHACLCVKPSGHVDTGDPVHACDTGCGGKWSGTYEGEGGHFKVVEYPTGRGEGLPR